MEDRHRGLEAKPAGCRFCDRNIIFLPALLSAAVLGLGLWRGRQGRRGPAVCLSGGQRHLPSHPGRASPAGTPQRTLEAPCSCRACALVGGGREGSRPAGLAGELGGAVQGQLKRDKKICNYIFKEKKIPKF